MDREGTALVNQFVPPLSARSERKRTYLESLYNNLESVCERKRDREREKETKREIDRKIFRKKKIKIK